MKNIFKNIIKTHTNERDSSVKADFEAFLSKYNCQFRYDQDEDDNTHRYFFDFQGGHFVANIKETDKGVDITYPSFRAVPIDEQNLVRAMCNKFNAQSTLFKFVYSVDNEENCINLHISFYVNTVFPDELNELLSVCFYFQRSFCDEYDDARKNQVALNSSDVERSFNNKLREKYLLATQELAHQNEPELERTQAGDTNLCLSSFLDKTLGLTDVMCDTITITRQDHCRTITEMKDIHALPVTSLLIEGEGREATIAAPSAVALLTCHTATDDTPRTVTITAVSEGQDQSSLYMGVTACLMPKPASRTHSLNSDDQEAESVSLLIAYDMTSPRDKLLEFDYMWKEALSKQKNGEKLNDDEQLLVDITNSDVAYNIYWGEHHMRNQRYGEALLHLENAFNALRTNVPVLSEKQKNTLTELCYDIGFCYTEFKQYQRAFYYLHLLKDNGNIIHNMELVNCLVNGKDIRSFSVIDQLMQSIKQQDEDSMSDQLMDFVNFLKRRRAYSLIDFNLLDEAEEAFKAMLEEPDNSDYALNELAYIQRLREEQDNTTAPEKDSNESN